MATCREGETGHGITAGTTREGKEKTQQDETEELEDAEAEHKGFSWCTCTRSFCLSLIQSLESSSRQRKELHRATRKSAASVSRPSSSQVLLMSIREVLITLLRAGT